MMNKKGEIVGGSILIFLGLFLILKEFGFLKTSFFSLVANYWPVILIIFGIKMILKDSLLSNLISIAIIFLLFFYIVFTNVVSVQTQDYAFSADLNNQTKEINWNLKYSAGNVDIDRTSENEVRLLYFNVDDKPFFETIRSSDSIMTINSQNHFNRQKFGMDQKMVLELNKNVVNNLNLNLAASSSVLDFTDLKIGDLNLEGGAMSSKVTFSRYPTKAKIDCGASTLTLNFPENYPIKLEIEGGLLNKNVNYFNKKDGFYVTEEFDETKDYLYVKVSAGVSSINTNFYIE